MKGNRARIVRSILFALSAMLAACSVPTPSSAPNVPVTPIVLSEEAALPTATIDPKAEVATDLYVLSPDTGSRKDRYLIEGSGVGSYSVGADLLVYGELNPGNEVAIALLKVVGKNPTSLTAQAILVDPNSEIRVRMRVDGNLAYLSASQLVPVFVYADGYLLRPNRIRLRPDHVLTVGAQLQALEFERINEEIVDALPTNTIMQITGIGFDGQIASVELLTGTWPLTGTIVALVATPPTATVPPIVAEPPTATVTMVIPPPTAIPPTETPSPPSATTPCSFAFLVLDAQTEAPIKGATVAVIVGVRQDTGATDSVGYYLAKLPCDGVQAVDARVRVFADEYGAYNRTIFLRDETTEILLERKTSAASTPTSTSLSLPTPTLLPPPPPTALPSATPTVACQFGVDPMLVAIWSPELGCALSSAQISWASYTPYERGLMMWREDTRLIYGFFQNGGWQAVQDLFQEGMPDMPNPNRGDPPPGLLHPIRGTGLIWATNEAFYQNLGWARTQQRGFCARIQNFVNGFIVQESGIEACFDGKSNQQQSSRAKEAEFDFRFLKAYNSNQWSRN